MRPLHFRLFWLSLGVALLAVVLYLTLSAPGLERGFPGGDKMAHGLGFFVLMFWHAALVERRYYLWLGLFLLALGGLIELAQSWMELGRRAEWNDFWADGAGIVLAGLLSLWHRQSWLQWLEHRVLGRAVLDRSAGPR
jgi:hypothetical protein